MLKNHTAILIFSLTFGGPLIASGPSLASGSGARPYVFVSTSVLTNLLDDCLREGGVVDHQMSHLSGFVAHISQEAAERIQKKYQGRALVEEDFEVRISDPNPAANAKAGGGTPTQPPQSIPWGIAQMQAPEAFTYSRGTGVTVCIVDTGIQASHPDLAANVLGGENFVSIRGKIDPAKWADDNGHGTHVSGTVAALDNAIGVVGVAPDAKLFATKVLDKRGSGFSSAVAEGIRSCVAHGASVISMSLGSSSDSTLIHGAVTDAYAAGAILVAAAGNESGPVSYPAKYPEVLAVSAVDQNLQFAYFSNFGPEVDFTAPGVSVNSTYMGSTYKVLSGTSMATPHVSGVAALMLSSQSLGILADDLGLFSEEQGAGFVNALKTVLNH